MRKKRDGESTRHAVIEAAGEMFARKGFSGTSITAIARHSGISEGLILYHFKSKSGLYDEVLAAISQRYADILKTIFVSDLPPQEMLDKALDAVFDFWQNDTVYQRINLWSYLEGRTGNAEAEKALTAGMASYLTGLREQGVLSADFDPVVFLTMIIGPIQFWARYKRQYAEILKMEGSPLDLDDRFLNNFKKQLHGLFR
ncbi:MAG: TetR/AcrR family transcriptional regulator [Spirochaetales bacterium]|nr:TetR/AcrR family transcriptional regulator [Spirochaetales bacterium]